MRRYQTLRIGLVLGLVPGLSACSSSPQGGAQKATNSNSAQRYLSGFNLPLAGPLSKFVVQKPPNNQRRPSDNTILGAVASVDAHYAHGPSIIRYSVWLFPTAAEAKDYNSASRAALFVPMADYTTPQSIIIRSVIGRALRAKKTAHQRRAYRNALIKRLQKWNAPTDAKTVDAIVAAMDRPITHTMSSGLRVGRFMIVGYASQNLNAIATGQAKPSLLLSDEQMRQTLRDVMLLLAQRAQARPEGNG